MQYVRQVVVVQNLPTGDESANFDELSRNSLYFVRCAQTAVQHLTSVQLSNRTNLVIVVMVVHEGGQQHAPPAELLGRVAVVDVVAP